VKAGLPQKHLRKTNFFGQAEFSDSHFLKMIHRILAFWALQARPVHGMQKMAPVMPTADNLVTLPSNEDAQRGFTAAASAFLPGNVKKFVQSTCEHSSIVSSEEKAIPGAVRRTVCRKKE
jgi:hypothetical protein